MNVGPFLFQHPWALAGLIALPLLWWLLRATPPEPKRRALPSLVLLDGLEPPEETPAKTPWWLLLLRMAAMALAIFGFSQPAWAPGGQAASAASGPTLIVIDDGWTSAQRWRDVTRTALAIVDEATQAGGDVRLLFTAPREAALDPARAYTSEAARQAIRTASPASWLPDHADAARRLAESKLKPTRVFWVTDGFAHPGGPDLMDRLSGFGAIDTRIIRPTGAFAILGATASIDGARVRVARPLQTSAVNYTLVAETATGGSIGAMDVTFPPGDTEMEALLAVPSAALNRVARFRIRSAQSAGATWLWDDTARRPNVGLADARDEAQPLLSEFYYVRKALEPHASLVSKPLAELAVPSNDAIILGDRSALPQSDIDALSAWIEEGGVLVRFAGPRLAAQGDALTPAPLRPSSRALGGAMAWENPQSIAPFPPTSPFAGITPPEDAQVRRQVLAEPGPALEQSTWARLADGTPLVTSQARGRGRVVLFHVTADPDWSDLPYAGAFVEMLRRSIASGGGRREAAAELAGQLAPSRILDGFGMLNPPTATTAPVDAADFPKLTPSPATPPGLYAGAQGERALNAVTVAPEVVQAWPAGFTVTEDEDATARHNLGGVLLALAMALLAADLLIALAFAGRLFGRIGRAGAAAAAALALVSAQAPEPAHAQSTQTSDLAREATLDLRFAYVRTGDSRLDNVTRAGLEGLGWQLSQRTSVEPEAPHGIDLSRDALEVYPLIYYALPANPQPLPPAAIARVNTYLRSGGAFIIDTRDAAPGREIGLDLSKLLPGIDAAPMQPVPTDHVLTRSFYLIKAFPGRHGSRLWIESAAAGRDSRRGDGVSGLFIGGADWAGGWALDEQRRPLFDMEGGQGAREMSYRFGVNLVMYVLTGNYKEDQVHVPALLERLEKSRSGEATERMGE